jgi:hypothetical protein
VFLVLLPRSDEPADHEGGWTKGDAPEEKRRTHKLPDSLRECIRKHEPRSLNMETRRTSRDNDDGGGDGDGGGGDDHNDQDDDDDGGGGGGGGGGED